MKLRFIPVIILFLICSCRETKMLSDEEKSLVADTIRQTLYDYVSKIKQNGLTAEFKFLDSSADFFWVPPGYSSAISYDSVAKILKQNAPAFKTIDNRFDSLRIVVLSKRLATYNAGIHSIVTDTSGKVYEMRLIETGLLIKTPGGWKLQSGQTSVLK